MCGGVSLLVMGMGLGTRAEGGTLYRFEADAGTVHYTNVPTDPRYQFYMKEMDGDTTAESARRAADPRRGLAAFAQAIRAAAERYRVDQRLVEAIILVESAGDPGAVSRKGAQGLMQLMPERAAQLGVQNAFNPLQNLDGGVRHLRDLLQRFAGNVTLALAAYNAGEAAVRTYGGIPPYAETQDYVRSVRALYGGPGRLDATAAAVTAPQEIYRQVDAYGTVVFTNLPPNPRATTRSR